MISAAFDLAYATGAAAELARRGVNKSNPPASRDPHCAVHAEASDDLHPLSQPSNLSSVSAVEAGRHANPSTPDGGYCCPVCASDLAGILPCERENDL